MTNMMSIVSLSLLLHYCSINCSSVAVVAPCGGSSSKDEEDNDGGGGGVSSICGSRGVVVVDDCYQRAELYTTNDEP